MPVSHGSCVSCLAGLLVASGMAALVYQVLWIKQLTLIVGVDVHAVTTGVSAFFAGLALGGLLLGRLADQMMRPLRLYVWLEICVAAVGIAVTFALSHTAPLFAVLEARSSVLAWTLVFLMVGIGPFLMGGTLPAIVRSLQLTPDRIASGGGWMYASNTSGAIIGALLASFVFIPAFGIQGSAMVAASFGLLAAAGAFLLDRRASNQHSLEPNSRPAPLLKSSALAILLYAVAGGLALGYEVLWCSDGRAIHRFAQLCIFRNVGDLSGRIGNRRGTLCASC